MLKPDDTWWSASWKCEFWSIQFESAITQFYIKLSDASLRFSHLSSTFDICCSFFCVYQTDERCLIYWAQFQVQILWYKLHIMHPEKNWCIIRNNWFQRDIRKLVDKMYTIWSFRYIHMNHHRVKCDVIVSLTCLLSRIYWILIV